MPPLREALALSLLSAFAVTQNGPNGTPDERPPEGFQLAIGLLQRELFEEAAAKFTAFLQQQPKHALVPEALYRRGLCRDKLQQRDEAIADLEQALAKGGAEFRLLPECRYRLGGLLEQKGDHEGAAAQFQALAKGVAKDHYLAAAAQYGAGEALVRAKQDGPAATAFTAAVAAATGEQASYRFPALYQLGLCQRRAQDWGPAASTFALAAAAAKDAAARSECWYLCGDAHLQQRAFDDAAVALAEVQGDFADDAAYALGFVAIGRGDQKAAAAAFGSLLEQFRESPLRARARLEQGRSLFQDQQPKAAAKALQPLDADGVEPAVRTAAKELLGLCALASGKSDQAVTALQQALAAAPQSEQPRLSFALAEALANLGRFEEAVAAYDAVPNAAAPELLGDARYGAGFALHELGRHADSIQRCQQVLALQPAHRLAVEAQLAMAENLFALQKYAEAEAAYAGLPAEPHGALAKWKLAWCKYLAGDKAEAAQRFAAVAKGESEQAEEALSLQCLALFEAGDGDGAMAAADRYRARHGQGAFLDRTERIAARLLRQRGDLAGAQERLRAAQQAAQGRGEANAALGDAVEQAELIYQRGDFAAAIGAFAALAARDDAIGARAAAGIAWCRFELGDDDGTKQQLQKAKAHPAVGSELAGLLELESALHHRRQEWPAAAAAASEYLQRFADQPQANALRYALGVAQSRGGDLAAARQTLAQLTEVAGYERPDRVWYELAWACRKAKDEPAALAAFAEVVARTQDEELLGECRLHLGVAALATAGADGDLEPARRLLLAVDGAFQPQARYRFASAEFARAGDDKAMLAAARDRFLQVAAVPGELVGEARYLAADCQKRLGDPAAAVPHLRQLLQQEPEHARAQAAALLLGECALAAQQYDVVVEALAPLSQRTDLPPADAARLELWLGRARSARNEDAAAEACLVRATERSDGAIGAEAQFRLGEHRQRRGDLRAAIDAYVKLPILWREPEWVRKGLLAAGDAYRELQQPDKAQRFYKELLEQHQGSAEAKAAAERQRSN
jgi:cellulose synthase operon protein C